MEFLEITEENAEEFSGFLDETMAENLGRVFYRGIGALDDAGNVRGAMVYELKNAETNDDTISRIHIFGGDDSTTKETLMKEYLSAVENNGVTESFYETEDDAMSRDLKDNGFSYEGSEGLDITVSMDELKGIRSLTKGKLPSHIVNLSDVSTLQYRGFIKKCLDNGSCGLVEDLVYLSMDYFEEEISSCSVTDGAMDGALLIKKAPSGVLYVLLYTAFGDEAQKNLALLMTYTTKKILEKYPEETEIVIRRHNAAVKNLTDRLFPGVKGKTVYKGSRNEEMKITDSAAIGLNK